MTIELFTSSQCEGCDKVKKMLLREKIDFKEISIDSEEGFEYFKTLGINSIPVIKVNNKVIPAPISEDKIKKLKYGD